MAVDVRSWSQRLRSIRNQLSMQIANRIRYSRGLYVEPACRQLSGLPPSQQNRIDQLRRRYAVAFEASLREETSINNYAYLDCSIAPGAHQAQFHLVAVWSPMWAAPASGMSQRCTLSFARGN